MHNYSYDKIGNLVADKSEEIEEISWTMQNKVKRITRLPNSDKPDLVFNYDGLGNRVSKTVIPKNSVNSEDSITTYYVRDAQGNVLATYEKTKYKNGDEKFYLKEQYLYGSSRIGMKVSNQLLASNVNGNVEIKEYDGYFTKEIGNKRYELTNHLGNVLAVVSDKKGVDNEPDVVSVSDYYPFGMTMPGRSFNANSFRFGYNTQEKTDEVAGTGNHYTAQYWEYNPQVVQRWNIDPKQIIGISPYAINGNNPIYYTDPLGDFRTKFGANVYKFFHGGDVKRAESGDRAGQYYVSKRVKGAKGAKGSGNTLDEVVVTQKVTWDSKISKTAEYTRGGAGAAWNFGKFLFGGGGNTTYGQGSFEADEMASSMGVKEALKKFRNSSPSIGDKRDFKLRFSPNPKSVVDDIINLENPFGKSISNENVNAHIDAIKDQSWTKLYIGGYHGTMTLIDANTVQVIIWNNTTANSFLLHGGELIFGKENGAQRFNDWWNKTLLLNTQSQTFEFTIPYGK